MSVNRPTEAQEYQVIARLYYCRAYVSIISVDACHDFESDNLISSKNRQFLRSYAQSQFKLLHDYEDSISVT